MRTRPAAARLTLAALLAALACAGRAGAAAPAEKGSLEPDPYARAVASYLEGNVKAAVSDLAKVIVEKPRNVGARILSARIAHVYEDYDAMRDEAARVVADFPPEMSRKAQDFAARGLARIYLGEPDKALEDFAAALKLDRHNMDVLAGRMNVWRQKGYLVKALADADELILRNPRTALYRLCRAQVHYEMKEYDKAVSDLRSGLQLNKEFHLAYGLLGTVLAAKGDAARAIKAYDKAAALEPSYAYAYVGRAALKQSQGDTEGALKDLQQVLAGNPRHFGAVFNKAEILSAAGRRDEALEAYREALGCELPDASQAALLGSRLASSLLWREAVEAYTRAFALSKRAAFLLKRSQAHEVLKDNELAMKDLDLAVELDPASPAAWASRGTLAAKMGRERSALEDLARASKLDSKDTGVLMARAAAMTRLHRAKEAADIYTETLEVDPTLAEAYNSRAALHANALSDLDSALKDIERAVELKPADPGFQYNLGVIRLKRRDFFKAIEVFTQALALRGPPTRILQMRSEAYSWVGNQARAVADMQMALERDPGNAGVYDTLGEIKLRAHDYESAAADFTRALEYDPASVAAYVHRGLARGGMGDTKAALKDFLKAADIQPGSKDALTNACWAKRELGDPDGGLRDCEKALESDPNHGPAFLHKGLCLLAMNDSMRAAESLRRAEELGVRPPESVLAQSLAYAKAKQYKQAHELYEAAVLLDPDVRSPDVTFGAVQGKADDFANAIAALQEEMEAAPPNPYIFLLRGDAQHSVGQYERAAMEFTKALEMDATVSDAFLARSWVQIAQNSLDLALQDMRSAVELEPKDAKVLSRLAALYTTRGEYKQATAAAAAALKSSPGYVEGHLRLGDLRHFQRDYKKSLEDFEKAAKLDPLNPNAFNGMGLAYFALKRNEDAVAQFSRAIALDPNSDRFYRNRGATYVKMKDFADAASDFRIAKLVSTDPARIEEYEKLATQAQARVPASASDL